MQGMQVPSASRRTLSLGTGPAPGKGLDEEKVLPTHRWFVLAL